MINERRVAEISGALRTFKQSRLGFILIGQAFIFFNFFFKYPIFNPFQIIVSFPMSDSSRTYSLQLRDRYSCQFFFIA